jgi:putative methyltransferase
MMLSKARCTNVTPINADFLMTDPSDPQFSSVTHMCVNEPFFLQLWEPKTYAARPRLLDPSCSGSGIVNRLDHLETGPLLDTYPPYLSLMPYRTGELCHPGESSC